MSRRIGEHIYAKTFCADYCLGLHPKSSLATRLQFYNSETLESDHVSFKIDNNCYNGFREKCLKMFKICYFQTYELEQNNASKQNVGH